MATKLLKKGTHTHQSKQRGQKKPAKVQPAKLSPLHRPEGMSLEDWQVELRRQFGREQRYRLRNLGDHPVFADFEVTNPLTKNTYRVVVRGAQTRRQSLHLSRFRHQYARHLQAHRVHARPALGASRRTGESLWLGFQPEYSEVFLHHGPRREVRFRPGCGCPAEPGPAAPPSSSTPTARCCRTHSAASRNS